MKNLLRATLLALLLGAALAGLAHLLMGRAFWCAPPAPRWVDCS